MEERLLKITEVAFILDIAPKTLEVWYWFKKKHPENEYAQLLPDFIQETSRGVRYWKESDIPKLKEFQEKKPKGRNGLFADITHMNYYKKQREAKKNGKKESKRSSRKS